VSRDERRSARGKEDDRSRYLHGLANSMKRGNAIDDVCSE
jgi:hypothetical protein